MVSDTHAAPRAAELIRKLILGTTARTITRPAGHKKEAAMRDGRRGDGGEREREGSCRGGWMAAFINSGQGG